MKLGKLIAIEGIDNSGKTTISADLVSYLRKLEIKTELAEELTTPIGAIILKYFESRRHFSSLLKTLLFAADRAILVEDIIEPSLSKNEIVIADRYYYSALAYRQADGFDLSYVRNVNKIFPRPDMTLYIDIEPTESKRRGIAHGKICPYGVLYLSKVREAYLDLASKEGFTVVDGMCSISELKRKTRTVVTEWLGHK